MSALDQKTATSFARIALANVVREFPNKLDHVLEDASEARTPRMLHPSFYGSYDWHSCVHMHWLLACVLHRYPDGDAAAAIGELFDHHFAPDAIAGELAYLERPSTESFERTYGWAWLLKLATELAQGQGDGFARWSSAIAPLAQAFVGRYLRYLPRAQYPLRYGVHNNSAFGLAFAIDYARASRHAALEALCIATARRWYVDDQDAPAAWEPSGADFLSPVLMEADLMSRVLDRATFADWLRAFLPGLNSMQPRTLFAPAQVSDRSDPQIVHLDGLNLSRAWNFSGIAKTLAPADPRRPTLQRAAGEHLQAGMTGLASGDYLGQHWLATFAMLALTA